MDSKTVYVDFDGTIVDVFARYYGILKAYIGVETKEEKLNEYIKMKRSGRKDHEIAKECWGENIDISDYLKFKRKNLEEEKWLRTDTIIGEPQNAYNELKKKGYAVKLLTQRRSKENFENQLGWLGLKNAFDDWMIVAPLHENAKLLFLKSVIHKEDILIGDGKLEMECAEKLNVQGFFVQTGLNERIVGKNISDTWKTYNEVAANI